MKKFYVTLAAALVASLSATAQEQLPNAGFEDGWTDCVPWTSKGDTKTIGTTPSPWTIAQVIGISGTGATQVGEKAEGYESASAVKVYNSPNSTLSSQIVPGYVTLGTTWSTSVMGSKSDGGTFGGIQLTSRPESITFMYKRTHDAQYDADGTEPATVVAYLWKGTFTQKDVPANIVLFGNPKKVNMENRDRNILGMTTLQGGAVTKTDDAELIAKIDYQITGDAEEWTELTIPFEYVSDATPEMFNVIFAAGDYWKTSPKRGNSLTIDNVRLNYPAEPVLVGSYSGNLVINMMGNCLNPDDDTLYDVLFYEAADGKCDLRLPNFALTDIGVIGDIAVENVSMTTDSEGKVTYLGHKTDLVLLDGAIYADVDCNGVSSNGHLYMDINVTWKMNYDPADPTAEYEAVPIAVAFSGLTGEEATLPTLYLVADGAEEYIDANKFTYADGKYTIEVKSIPENFRIEGENGMPVFGAIEAEPAEAPARAAANSLASLNARLGSKTPFTGSYTLGDEKNSFVLSFPWDGKATSIASELSEKVVSGIADITAGATDAPVYFNLQGQRVAQPQSGLYIEVRGGKATKVAL